MIRRNSFYKLNEVCCVSVWLSMWLKTKLKKHPQSLYSSSVVVSNAALQYFYVMLRTRTHTHTHTHTTHITHIHAMPTLTHTHMHHAVIVCVCVCVCVRRLTNKMGKVEKLDNDFCEKWLTHTHTYTCLCRSL